MRQIEGPGPAPGERQPILGPGASTFVTWFLLALLISLLGTNVKGYYQQRDACRASLDSQATHLRQ